MKQTREKWIDNVKVSACILVALGHFFQSMVSAGLMPASSVYQWFIQTIYYFHVPLFFVCSGYLYQKSSTVHSFCTWKNHVLKKMLVLGVPYFTFSLLTWGMKVVFSDSVNSQVNSLWFDLLVQPLSPYWYLYALFFVFLITPTFSNVKMAVTGLLISLGLKLVSVFGGGTDIYAVSTVCANEIWFVIGMSACVFDIPAMMQKWASWLGCVLLLLFAGLSVTVWFADIDNGVVSLFMGILACSALVVLALRFQNRDGILAPYTMPIYLMHTIFAAGVRAVLLKMGMTNIYVHILCGIGASFAGPIIVAKIMQYFKWPEFFLYPVRFLKTSKKVT